MNLDYDSARIVEEIQQGLKHLDEEEENLVVLRDQLTKVKRFREEQARKDDMIATLQERIRQLQYEKEFGTRQSAELEEIMSERILTLERSLAERDQVEKQFLEFQVQAEVVEMERDSLKEELHAEKNSHDQTRMECTDLINKIHRLQGALESDQQVAMKTRMLFDALKTELHKKETELSVASTRYKQSTQQFKQELAVARKAVEDMAERLILLEEEKASAENAAHRAKAELDGVHQEAAQCQGEVARWASMYTELEKVLSSLKTQISTAQFSHVSEVDSLRSELARCKQDIERGTSELAAHSSTLSSVVTDMSSITSLQIPTSLTQLHHYRSEVVAIVRSLKRFVQKLPDTPLNTVFRHIASIVDDLSHRSLTYQEALFMSTSTGSQEAQRAAELDNRLHKVEHELAQADSAAEKMLQMFSKAGFVYQLSDEESGSAEAKSGKSRVESLHTEHRTKLYEALTLATTTALRQLSTATHDTRSLHEKELKHHEELRAVTEALHSLQSKYNTEMEHMHRMNEEALIAVRVATYESGSEVSRMKEECSAKYRHSTSELEEQVRALRAEAEVHLSYREQCTLCLDHLIVYTTQLQRRYDALHSVYYTLRTVHQKDQKLIRGLDSLASCCTTTTKTTLDHSDNRKSTEVYQFEPFLDPLEEAVGSGGRVSFRVAVLYVLAALRFRKCMREARVRDKPSVPGSGIESVGMQLPPVYVLRENNSRDVARMLLRSSTITVQAGTRSNQVPLHNEMSMDEFDAYLADYHRHQEHRSPARDSTGGGRRTLLEALGSPLRTARSGAKGGSGASSGGGGGGIYQLHRVSVLYKTLTDMSTTISKDKAELAQLQTIIVSLEDHVRTQEKTLGQQQHTISQARELESHLRRLISELERDKRSKSYHVLKEIQDELRSDFVSMHVPPVQKYVPLGVTYPQYSNLSRSGVGSGVGRSPQGTEGNKEDSAVEEDFDVRMDDVDASIVLESSFSAADHTADDSYSYARRSPPRKSPTSASSVRGDPSHSVHTFASSKTSNNASPARSKLPTSWPETPVPGPGAGSADADADAARSDSSFVYTSMDAPPSSYNQSGGGSGGRGSTGKSVAQHHAMFAHQTTHAPTANAVHARQPEPVHTSAAAQDSFSYSELQDLSVLDQSIDGLISGALYPPPADISWSQNDSYHTHFTGTDKDVHVSPGYSGGSGGKSGGGKEVGSGDRGVDIRRSDFSDSVLNYDSISSSARTHNLQKAFAPPHATHSPARTERLASQKAHNEEIQAIYSDIGRLGGKLGSKLRSASPTNSTSSARSLRGIYQGRK